MTYTQSYDSPLGKLLLAANDSGLTGLWFNGEKYYAQHLGQPHKEKDTPILQQTKHWLDVYFSGQEPNFTVPFHVTGTAFQHAVWAILCTIPYGKTTTYGNVAKQIASQRGLPCMSAQAVGGAVGRNEISIIIPCHRVIGANGSLTGYAGGLDKKIRLLALEKAISAETSCASWYLQDICNRSLV